MRVETGVKVQQRTDAVSGQHLDVSGAAAGSGPSQLLVPVHFRSSSIKKQDSTSKMNLLMFYHRSLICNIF